MTDNTTAGSFSYQLPECDVVVVTPGGRELTYQDLGRELTAIEPPLWARLITGYLRDHHVDVQLLDTEALNLSPDNAAAQIAASGAKLVVLVAFGHQPSASTQTMIPARQLGQAINASHSVAKTLIIGGHVAALPENTVRHEPVDYACRGEGPITALQLWEYIKGQRATLQDVAGLAYLDNGKYCFTATPPLINALDKELHGNVWDMLPMSAYRAHNWQCFGELDNRQPYASIYTSLGCPYKCVFCCINAPFETQKYRCRSPQAVVDEIDLLVTKYGVKTFKIIDEMFVLKKNHYIKICELLAAKPYASELNIWAYARVDTVRADTLQLLRSAGIRWLALGIESADETVRDGANKSLSADDIVHIVRDIQAADINVIGNFIFGLPNDTARSMQQTLDLAKTLRCEFINVYSAMAYPGSALYTQAVQQQWALPQDWDGYSQHSVTCRPLPTAALTAAQVLAFRDHAFHEYFDDPEYLAFVQRKFGPQTREHIEQMAQKRLNRDIVDDHTLADCLAMRHKIPTDTIKVTQIDD